MKNQRIFIIMCVLLLSPVLYAENTAKDQDADVPLPPKIIAAYWGIKSLELAEQQLSTLKEHGLNTTLLKHTHYTLEETLLQGWSNMAAKAGLRFFPVLNFAGSKEIPLFRETFNPYVDRHGKVFAATPCPLDVYYWDVAISQRFQQLAQLSQASGIVGALFDTEMYGSELSVYTDVCFCDFCWQRFIEAAQRRIPTQKKEQRFAYLMENHLFESYEAVQTKALQEILSEIRLKVHSINPKLVLGFVAFVESWFYQGLIHGLGTLNMPVRVFSERTYIRGYTPDVLAERAFITETSVQMEPLNASPAIEPIAEYIPGLWLGRFFPERLPSELYALATHANGYWLFTADSLWSDTPKHEPYALHGKNDDYWNAIKAANTELHRHANNPGGYHSKLPAVYQSSFHEKSQHRLIRPPSLARFMQDVVTKRFSSSMAEKTRMAKPLNYREETLFHCIKMNNVEGEIRISNTTKGKRAGQIFYRIFDSNGEIIREGSISAQDALEKILIPPEYFGLLSLMIQSGVNSTQVEISGMPYVVEASSTFHLSTGNTPHTYTFFVKPEIRIVQLRTYYHNEHPAQLTVLSPGNQVIQRVAIKNINEVQLPTYVQDNHSLERMGAQTISIQAEPSKQLGNVSFYFFNEEFPYVIVRK